MRFNNYEWDAELGLVVTQSEGKSFDDIKRVVSLDKPDAVIDLFIHKYIVANDPNQAIEDEWYKLHLLVESSDPDEIVTAFEFDTDTQEVMKITKPNSYNVSLAHRAVLEDGHDWLVGYRGIESPERPETIIDIEAWKLSQSDLFKVRNKLNAFVFKDVVCSVTEADQNGWASLKVLTDTIISLGGEYQVLPFTNENGNVVVLDTYEEYIQFIMAGAVARTEFFT